MLKKMQPCKSKKAHLASKSCLDFWLSSSELRAGPSACERRYVAPADAVGIILTSRDQGGALAFQVCFLGRICRNLGVEGQVELRSHLQESLYSAQTGAAAFLLMESSRTFLWFTVGFMVFTKSGVARESHPHTDSKSENWCKNDISFFQEGLRNILAEPLSTWFYIMNHNQK